MVARDPRRRVQRRSARDERRRLLGQNFLLPERAERFVSDAGFAEGDLVVEIGAGKGAVTRALLEAGAQVIAIEVDPIWADRLENIAHPPKLRIVRGDFLDTRLPAAPFRVAGCVPFGITTKILHRLLDDPAISMTRADLIVQYEVARKRSETPPSTLLSASWAPWWEMNCGPRISSEEFRPVPRVDGGVLTVLRRDPSVLPFSMAHRYAQFVRQNWPFQTMARHEPTFH